jgi:hypothetical protein
VQERRPSQRAFPFPTSINGCSRTAAPKNSSWKIDSQTLRSVAEAAEWRGRRSRSRPRPAEIDSYKFVSGDPDTRRNVSRGENRSACVLRNVYF